MPTSRCDGAGMTNDLHNLIHSYIEAWNETDAARRRQLVARVWTDDGAYLDPLMSGTGHDRIDAMIAGAQEQFPGHRFELSFGPDAHDGRVRFATLGQDGRLQSVTGFLESPVTA